MVRCRAGWGVHGRGWKSKQREPYAQSVALPRRAGAAWRGVARRGPPRPPFVFEIRSDGEVRWFLVCGRWRLLLRHAPPSARPLRRVRPPCAPKMPPRGPPRGVRMLRIASEGAGQCRVDVVLAQQLRACRRPRPALVRVACGGSANLRARTRASPFVSGTAL